MQAAIRFNQARSRTRRRDFFRHQARQLGALAGELLALASLALALTTGMMLVSGLVGGH